MKFIDIPQHECHSEFNEKQLMGEMIQDLQELEHVFGREGATECVLWFPQREAFVSNVSRFGASVHIQGYQYPTLEVELLDEHNERSLYWHVHAKSLAIEQQIVAHLLTIPDSTGVTSLSVTSMLEVDTPDRFPCSPCQIKKIFHNNMDRELHIDSFALDEAQTVALVEVDFPLRIKLSSCEFLSSDTDDTTCPFHEALQRRTTPLQSLCFQKSLPFVHRQLEYFWNIAASKTITNTLCLEELDISKESGFGAMASVPVETLALRDCTFGRHGAGVEIVATAIHCGFVSRGLVWDGLDSLPGPSWYALASAIANCQLTEFRLADLSAEWMDPLILGVLEMVERNPKLERLCIGDIYNFSPDAWKYLMWAVSKHPSLEVLQVENVLDGRSYHEIPQDFPETVLQPLADMMKVNRRIEVDVPLCRYKRKFGDTDPIERIKNFNRFSRQVEKLGQMEDLEYRFALVGAALVEYQTDFRKLSLLMTGHIDLLVPSFMYHYNEEHGPSPNKRARIS